MNPLELPNGWKQVSLGDIAELVTSGATPKVGNAELYSDENGGIPFFRIQNVGINHLILSDVKYVAKEVHERDLKRSQLRSNDVLITITGRLGTSAVVPSEITSGNINQHICLIRLRQSVADPYYISFHLNSGETHREIMQKQHGATRIALSHRTISSLRITLPPLEVQRRISSILRRAHGLGEMRGQANQVTNKIIQSVFLKMFGDVNNGQDRFPRAQLGELIENLDSKRVPLNEEQRSRRKGKVPYYGASGLVDWIDDFLFDEQLLLVAEDGENLRSRKLPVAYSISGKSWVNNHAHVLRCVGINQKFLESWINLLDLSTYLGGSTRPKLNKTTLMSMPVPVPPRDLQERFASSVKKIDVIKNHQIEGTHEIDELFDCLMHKAFRGELVNRPKA